MKRHLKRRIIRTSARISLAYLIASATAAGVCLVVDSETVGVAPLVSLFVIPSILGFIVLELTGRGRGLSVLGFVGALAFPASVLAWLWSGAEKGPHIAAYALLILVPSASAAFIFLACARTPACWSKRTKKLP